MAMSQSLVRGVTESRLTKESGSRSRPMLCVSPRCLRSLECVQFALPDSAFAARHAKYGGTPGMA